MSRRILWIVVGLAVIGVLFGATAAGRLYLARTAAVTSPASETVGFPSIGGPFALLDHSGRAVTERDYRGRLMLLFFGYTYCPDVCPTELQVMAAVMDELGAAAEKVQPLFVTVDPARDTVEVMADYIGNFHPRLVGLTGTAAQVAAAAKAYRVAYFKAEPAAGEDETDADDYLMNHTAFTYLMGADGQFLELFRRGIAPEEMAARIRARLEALSS